MVTQNRKSKKNANSLNENPIKWNKIEQSYKRSKQNFSNFCALGRRWNVACESINFSKEIKLSLLLMLGIPEISC